MYQARLTTFFSHNKRKSTKTTDPETTPLPQAKRLCPTTKGKELLGKEGDQEESNENWSKHNFEQVGSMLPIGKACRRLGMEFYAQDCVTLSKALLGQLLVRVCPDGCRLAGRIVEVEAYLGGEDKGSHSYNGKKTQKNKSMYMPSGTAYVYKIYGAYHCLNISSEGEGAAVLVRAVEPTEGHSRMSNNRAVASGKPVSHIFKDSHLCSGPGKIGQAMQIDLALDGINLITSEELWLEEGTQRIAEKDIQATPRINIDYAGEWKDKPLRFYIKNNVHVSKPAFSTSRNK